MANFGELSRVVRGRVLVGGDEGFEQARRPWNLAVEQPVAAVVEAADAEDVEAADAQDVAAVVRFARAAGLVLSAQSTGHGATGDVEGVILLRTGRLDHVEVRPQERIARVGADARWGQVQAAKPYGPTGRSGSFRLRNDRS